MSLYNILHGVNPASGILLGLIGNPNVGRFRDAFVSVVDGEPQIVIHTRNGGGNRECSCLDSPKWGTSACKHHTIEEDGRTYYVCEAPCSDQCYCTGCIAEFQLPSHPQYIRDEDDDFDCTYANFYFRAPEDSRDAIMLLVTPESERPSNRWRDFLAAMDSEEPISDDAPPGALAARGLKLALEPKS